MKLRILAVAVCLLALCAASSAFAAKGAQTIGVNVGAAFPTGDFGNSAGTGFFGGATYTYHLNEQFGIGGDLNYFMFGKKSIDIPFIGSVSYTPHFLQIGVHGKYFLPMKDAKMAPYGKVGLGMYNYGVKAETPSYTLLGTTYPASSTTTSSSKFGFSLGIGTTMKLSDKASWGAEANYHMISVDNGNGGSTSANMFTIAVSYMWGLGK